MCIPHEVNLSCVPAADELRKSLFRITVESDLDRLPYGTIIVTGVKETPGIFTLIKIAQGDWRIPIICGNPSIMYQIEEDEESLQPDLPALLVLCGEELPEDPKPQLVLIKGGGQEPDSQ